MYLDIACIILLIIAIILLVILIFSKKENHNNEEISNKITYQMVKELGEVKEHVAKEISSNNEKLLKDIANNNEKQINMYHNFEKSLNESLSKNIKELNEKVEGRLNEGFNKTNQTFQGILERISKIDEAQKKIQELSTNIISLQDILSDKKSRGCFGEIQLHSILASIFGDKNDQVYELQKHLPNGMISDAVLYTPKP